MKTKSSGNIRILMLAIAIAAVLLIGPGMALVAEKVSVAPEKDPNTISVCTSTCPLYDPVTCKCKPAPGKSPLGSVQVPAARMDLDHCVQACARIASDCEYGLDTCSCKCRQAPWEPVPTITPTPIPEYTGPCGLFCPNGYDPNKYCACLEKPKIFDW